MSGKYGLSIRAEAKSIAVSVENDCVNAIAFKQVPNFYSAVVSWTDDVTAGNLADIDGTDFIHVASKGLRSHAYKLFELLAAIIDVLSLVIARSNTEPRQPRRLEIKDPESVSHNLTDWSCPPVINLLELHSNNMAAQPPSCAWSVCLHVDGTIDCKKASAPSSLWRTMPSICCLASFFKPLAFSCLIMSSYSWFAKIDRKYIS